MHAVDDRIYSTAKARLGCVQLAELLLFHHAQGLTPRRLAFADELSAAGHVVHAPDLYDGNTFIELADGVGYAEQVGFDTIIEY